MFIFSCLFFLGEGGDQRIEFNKERIWGTSSKDVLLFQKLFEVKPKVVGDTTNFIIPKGVKLTTAFASEGVPMCRRDGNKNN